MTFSSYDRPELAAEFWHRPDVRQALHERDMGALFRLLKNKAKWSQTQIGMATAISQGRVSKIINGQQTVATLKVLRRIAEGLDMPHPARVLLGIAPSHPAAGTSRPVTGQHRAPTETGVRYPATATEAVTTVSGLWQADDEQAPDLTAALLDSSVWNTSALAWLIGHSDESLAREREGKRVGHSDVVRVRETAKVFAQLDNRFGGAHSRRILVNYLRRDAAVLMRGSYTEDVGRALFSTVAETVLLAAWMSYDSGLHPLAQRYFVQALRLADAAGDKRLAGSVLSAMSHQATFLDRPTEAVNLARAALTGTATVSTPKLTAQFHSMEARALARLGDAHACNAVLTATEASFASTKGGPDPEFIAYFNEAELADEFGHCYRDLGDHDRAAYYATRAAYGPGDYDRSDFFATMILAQAHAGQGEPEQACQAALTALSTGEMLTSARCATYVREFRHQLDRFTGNAAVAEFHEQATAFQLWQATS